MENFMTIMESVEFMLRGVWYVVKLVLATLAILVVSLVAGISGTAFHVVVGVWFAFATVYSIYKVLHVINVIYEDEEN